MTMKTTAISLLLLTMLAAVACQTGQDESTGPAGQNEEHTCSPAIPEPPHPLPDEFDWRPLAEQWCAQLASCGLGTDGCVDVFLESLDQPIGSLDQDGTEQPPLEAPAVVLGCKDSDDYALDPGACAELVE